MGHPFVQDKSKSKSKVNCPTQAKGGLVWATRPSKTRATARAKSTAPHKPKEGLYGPPVHTPSKIKATVLDEQI
jgi:hypothetical protein